MKVKSKPTVKLAYYNEPTEDVGDRPYKVIETWDVLEVRPGQWLTEEQVSKLLPEYQVLIVEGR